MEFEADADTIVGGGGRGVECSVDLFVDDKEMLRG